jgi:hypothetical protein
VMGRMVFQAGVDFEFVACPPPMALVDVARSR